MNQSATYSSSNPTTSQGKHDVFLSFRGEDTRNNFTSHLYTALSEKKIPTFIDNVDLERGEEISPTLLEAIEVSKISIAILSEKYASSKWCLEELVKILDCMRNNGLMVIPVFYRVDPSHVRNQTGSFADAFVKHEGSLTMSKQKVQSWRAALKDVANLSGWDSLVTRPESELIKEITKDVLLKLNKTSMGYHYKGLVGIESRIQHIQPLLNLESPYVTVVGIWGMGGLGKTTLARAIYDQISTRFESCCFVCDLRVKTMDQLQNELFPALLGEGNASISTLNLSFVKDRLSRTKVLVAVDDFKDGLVSLLATWFGPGSRILVTSRDKQVLKNTADKIYTMEKLNEHEALQLFSMKAFKQDCPPSDRILQAKRVVSYAKGNPLALTVLGSTLLGRNDEDWDSMLKRLGNIRISKIHDVLKTSYDGLDPEEKRIFLVIVCFFRGQSREYVTKILDAAFTTSANYSAHFPMTTLIDKSLIMVTSSNELKVHDLLQEMGREIADDESTRPKNPVRLLINPKRLKDALMENKRNGAIEGISVDMSMESEIHLEPDVFAKMYNLRFLEFYWPNEDFHRYREEKFHLSCQGLQSLSKTLTYLNWTKFPLNSIPSKFFPESLVVLRLPYNKVKKLWDGVQNLVNLIEIDLSLSEYLTEIPDLSKAIKIETIKLYGCGSLVEVHPSIQFLHKLEFFYLHDCKRLRYLPRRIESKALKILNMGDCPMVESCPEITQANMNPVGLCLWGSRNLRSLPDSICNLTWLNLGGSGIQELPSSIEHLSCLCTLNLRNCRYLERLPSCIQKLPQLRYLDVSRCESLSSLPELPPSLHDLVAHNCISLQTISTNFRKCCNLKFANFANSSRLDQKALAAEAQFTTPNYCRILLYPGSEVPGWFTHRSTGSSINIQFPLNWDQFKGVVFGIVYEFRRPDNFHLMSDHYGFKMDLLERDNSCEVRDGLWSCCYCPIGIANSDHVLIVYQRDNPLKEYSATLSSFQFCPIVLNRYSRTEEKNNVKAEILKHWKVKRCGVHLIRDDAESIISQTLSSSTSLPIAIAPRCSLNATAGKRKRCPVGSSTAAASSFTSRPVVIAATAGKRKRSRVGSSVAAAKRKHCHLGIIGCRSIYHVIRLN